MNPSGGSAACGQSLAQCRVLVFNDRGREPSFRVRDDRGREVRGPRHDRGYGLQRPRRASVRGCVHARDRVSGYGHVRGCESHLRERAHGRDYGRARGYEYGCVRVNLPFLVLLSGCNELCS